MRVDDKPVEQYLKNFEWDFAKYQPQGKTLAEIVGQIQSMASRIDDELKKYAVELAEKAINMSSLQRRKIVNFSTSELEDFLKPAVAATIEPSDPNGTLITLIVSVPKALEKGL